MAGTGNSTPQAGDAGVIPVPQAGETPEAISEWLGRGNVTASEVLQARYVPQKGKSLATGLEDHPAWESSDEEENDSGHQGINAKASAAIFELELKEYMKRKEAHQCVPVIAEAMDALNAPQWAEESQQNFERRQNAACRQATISRVPLRAVSDIKTTMSKVVDEEVEILQPPQIPGQHVTIKEEALERSVPAGAENSQVIARRIPMVDSWNEHVNYQRMRNQDLCL
ncbi:hypothetical protein C0995_013301 [Termitomyces sp. Mi166|nr:hypothetical protein C0995_013301 [Termitomyces sp. Mi166\